jgi:hypothetical protein
VWAPKAAGSRAEIKMVSLQSLLLVAVDSWRPMPRLAKVRPRLLRRARGPPTQVQTLCILTTPPQKLLRYWACTRDRLSF